MTGMHVSTVASLHNSYKETDKNMNKKEPE
jgi:hypothetical protein